MLRIENCMTYRSEEDVFIFVKTHNNMLTGTMGDNKERSSSVDATGILN